MVLAEINYDLDTPHPPPPPQKKKKKKKETRQDRNENVSLIFVS